MAMGIVMLVSNLVSGKIASEKGGLRTVRLTYLAEAALMFLLPTAVASAVLGMADLLIMGLFMYLFNSSVQMHLMEIANRDYPEAITLASSLNPTSFNIGITFASLLGGVIYDTVGINYLGYAGCACILVASVMTFAVCRLCRAAALRSHDFGTADSRQCRVSSSVGCARHPKSVSRTVRMS